MKTSNILNVSKTAYTSKEAAKEAVKFITDLAGIKLIECDGPKDYITFITLEKSVLITPGCALYAIWISNTYDTNNKLIHKIKLQIEESFSMRIASLIKEAIQAGRLILTDSMNKKVLESA